MTALGADLADIDFRVEVGGEGVAVIAAVDVDDIQFMDLVEVVFGEVSGEQVGRPGVETTAQDRRQASLLEPVLVGPLPLVFEPGGIAGFVVGSVQVVHASGQAGVHDGEVLVGQGHVDHQLWLLALQQGGQFLDIVGVHLCGGNWAVQLGGDGPAFRLVAAGQDDIRKHFWQLRAFVGDDSTHAAGTNDHDF